MSSKHERPSQRISGEAERITAKLIIEVLDIFPSTADSNINTLEKRYKSIIRRELIEIEEAIK